jgi:hypothetical protein
MSVSRGIVCKDCESLFLTWLAWPWFCIVLGLEEAFDETFYLAVLLAPTRCHWLQHSFGLVVSLIRGGSGGIFMLCSSTVHVTASPK